MILAKCSCGWEGNVKSTKALCPECERGLGATVGKDILISFELMKRIAEELKEIEWHERAIKHPGLREGYVFRPFSKENT